MLSTHNHKKKQYTVRLFLISIEMSFKKLCIIDQLSAFIFIANQREDFLTT